MRKSLLVLAAFMASTGLAQSQPTMGLYDTFTHCQRETELPDLIIKNCAAALKMGLGTSNASVNAGMVSLPLLYMGAAYARKGQNDEALKHFNLSLQAVNERLARAPSETSALSERCWIRGILGTELEAAIVDCDEALKSSPANTDYLRIKGFALYRQGKYQAAVASFDQALEGHEDNSRALFLRGVTKIRLDDLPGANGDIKKAREVNPDIDKIFSGYGIKLG
jgi:tetratricopeptide (TPR) repeat protein